MKYSEGDKVAFKRALDKNDTYWKGYGFDKAIIKTVEKTHYIIVGDEGNGDPLYVKENEIISR